MTYVLKSYFAFYLCETKCYHFKNTLWIHIIFFFHSYLKIQNPKYGWILTLTLLIL
jgi:hypothetical protein